MNRKFKCSGLAMLIASATLAESFEKEKAAFVAESPYYDDPYIVDLKAAIQVIMTDVFGIDPKDDLKAASRQVNGLVKSSVEDLSMVREQLIRGFRLETETADLLLTQLGFRTWWPKARHGGQEAVIGLLSKFRNNMSAETRLMIEAKGVSAARIDNILANAASLNAANIDQELLKSSSKEDTGGVTAQMNVIYDKAIDICKIGKRLFKQNEYKRNQFVFSKILAAQRAANGTDDSAEEEAAE